MTDDASDDPGLPLSRRSLVKTLGVGGAAAGVGLGALSGVDDAAVAAQSFDNYPIGPLPGLTYTTSVDTYEPKTDTDGETFGYTQQGHATIRSVKQTNVRIIEADDAARPTCGEDIRESVEYQFVVSGVARTREHHHYENGTASGPPMCAFSEIGLFDGSDTALRVGIDDDPCDMATLRPHYTESAVFDGDWGDSDDGRSTTETELESMVEDVAPRPDAVSDAFVGSAGTWLSALEFLGDNFPEHLEVPNWVGRAATTMNLVGAAQDLFSSNPTADTTKEYGTTSLEVGVDGGQAIRYVAFFSVRVPADGDEVVLTIDHEVPMSFPQANCPGYGPNYEIERRLAPSLTFEVTIPGNDDPDSIEEVAYPEMTTLTPYDVDYDTRHLQPNTFQPDVGETMSVDTHDDVFSSIDAPADYQWRVDGNAVDTGTTTEHTFDDGGRHSLEFRAFDHWENHRDELDVETTHGVTFHVGDDPHLRPNAELTYRPDPVEDGDEVTLDGSQSFAPGDDLSYSWEVTSYPANQDYRAEPSPVPLTRGDDDATVSFVADSDRQYAAVLEVESAGHTDYTNAHVLPRPRAFAEIDRDTDRVTAGDEVTLDATGSEPATGSIDSYEWRIESYPKGSTYRVVTREELSVSGPDEDVITFTPPDGDRVYSVVLEVQDGEYTDSTNHGFVAATPVGVAMDWEPRSIADGDVVDLEASVADDVEVERLEWTITAASGDADFDEVDGRVETGRTTSFEADAASEYEVVLAVEAADGATGSTTEYFDPESTRPRFEVGLDSIDDPLVVEESAVIEATVHNDGDDAGSQPVALTVDGRSVTERSVSLDAGDNETLSFEYVASAADVPSVDVRVTSADDEAEATVDVVEYSGPEPVELDDGSVVQDVDGDDLYRDVDADGTVGQGDIAEFFGKQHRDAWKRPDLFDFSGNGAVTHGDVVELADYVALE